MKSDLTKRKLILLNVTGASSDRSGQIIQPILQDISATCVKKCVSEPPRGVSRIYLKTVRREATKFFSRFCLISFTPPDIFSDPCQVRSRDNLLKMYGISVGHSAHSAFRVRSSRATCAAYLIIFMWYDVS